MKTIKAKIFRSFLTVSIASLFLTGLLSEMVMFNLRGISTHSNEQIGFAAAGRSETALIAQALNDTAALSAVKAQLIGGNLSRAVNNLNVTAAYVNNLYTHSEQFLLIPYNHSSQCPVGVPTMQWLMSPGVRFEDVKNETYLHGNMRGVYEAIMKNNPAIMGMYLTTVTGINSGYDANAADKPEVFEGRYSAWYTNARDSGGPVFSDTYQDSFGRGLTLSISIPCYGANDRFVGVLGLDILIEDLNEMIMKTVVSETGYAFLLRDGEKVISALGLTQKNERDMELFLGNQYQAILASMESAPSGVSRSIVHRDGKAVETFIIWTPVEMVGWHLVFALPVDDILVSAYAARAEIERLADGTVRDVNRQILFSNVGLIVLFALVMALISWMTARISGKITHPITVLEENIGRIAGGDLDTVIDIKTGDEIERLGCSVNTMTLELKEYIANLSKVTAEKERINSDLRIATDIQADMLPKIFPPFSNRDDFHIAPVMIPAKEVGGDFYDFFFIDDEQTKIALVIADVSGKGVPAALFMVISKILLKNNKDLPVDQILYTVNNLLCADNNSSMFVTTYFSTLDLKTGEYIYASAGHNPPILCRANGEAPEYLTLPRTPPLAVFPDKKFETQTLYLKKGDMMLLYTDGVTEAFNSESQMYGMERLLRDTWNLSGKPVKTINDFAGEEPQFDDITMLCFRFFGKE